MPELARTRVSIDDVMVEIRRVFEQELGLQRELSPELDLQRDLALDSLSLMTLVVSLEDRFRIIFREEDATHIRTIADLAAHVVQRVEESC